MTKTQVVLASVLLTTLTAIAFLPMVLLVSG